MRHREIDCVARAIKGDDVTKSKEDHRERVCPLGPLWSVSEGTDKNDEENTDVELEEYLEDDLTGASGEEVESIGGAVSCGGFDKLREQLFQKFISRPTEVKRTKKKAR